MAHHASFSIDHGSSFSWCPQARTSELNVERWTLDVLPPSRQLCYRLPSMALVHLESLKLKGFKSFPDQVELTFPGAVSAVIGPNGCGKSNIVDGMLWVLGEQSPSLLRLKHMGDVVFSGASGRKPAGSAEVVMVLGSDDGRWEGRDGRLEIRLRVLRSGPSE